MASPQPEFGSKNVAPTKARYLLTLLAWLCIAPVGMALALISILQHGGGWTTPYDAVFLALFILGVAARWHDFINGDPVTSEGKGAKPGAAWKYTVTVGAVGAALWVVANLIGNYILSESAI